MHIFAFSMLMYGAVRNEQTEPIFQKIYGDEDWFDANSSGYTAGVFVTEQFQILHTFCEQTSSETSSFVQLDERSLHENVWMYENNFYSLLHDMHVPNYKHYQPRWHLISYKDL